MRLNATGSNHTVSKYVLQRELGNKFPLGFQDKFRKRIYISFSNDPKHGFWDQSTSGKSGNSGQHGGVFNLEYSPDGSILIAACEQKSFIVLDPITRRDVHNVYNSHSDCVNCVKFLDCRTFATCSDDTTVALWDIRNLKQKMRTLRGHSNWVKNIEFVREEGLLVTSGFDGCVFTWDINSYTEQGFMSQRVFHTNGLMRMRLTPDNTKMILCTAGGYIMIIHNLDFATLNQDLAGFKPNMYRLMQISQTPISLATNFSHLFRSKRNRIELISDWPAGNEAEVISSLHVHPQGWCVVSRNTSNLDKSEWTCVHDIQDMSLDSPAISRKRPRVENEESQPSTSYPVTSSSSGSSSDQSDEETHHPRAATTNISPGPQVEVRITAPLQWGTRTGEAAGFHLRLDSDRVSVENESIDNLEVRIPSEEVLEALETIRRAQSGEDENHTSEFRIRHRMFRRNSTPLPARLGQLNNNASSSDGIPSSSLLVTDQRDRSSREDVAWEDSENPNITAHFVRAVADLAARSVHLLDPFRLRSRHDIRRHPPSLTYDAESRGDFEMDIHSNLNRITYFVEEPNVGRGYIKELCFSPDGRVIASPYSNGVRLLTFNPQCADMSYSLSPSAIRGTRSNGNEKEPPHTLHSLTTNKGHSDVVVTTKFSPTHPLFVSGCLGGKIVWHQPVL
ncbi:DDB1- and CUL4-associated factor 10 [Daphnia magna]|uniref:DDB1- and CUL4-associated factor 10 n=1 Tax=Daphnia magna TaxID=35525 RepID=UPI001E1BAF9A|nr:DDB1- and CUL4-associated factor 10 [Daphnia magna]